MIAAVPLAMINWQVRYQTRIPRVNTQAGDAEFVNEELENDASGMTLIFADAADVSIRNSNCRREGF